MFCCRQSAAGVVGVLGRCHRRAAASLAADHIQRLAGPSLATTSFLRWNRYIMGRSFIGAEGGSCGKASQ